MRIAILSLYSGLIDRGVETWVRNFSSHLSEKHNILVLQGSDEKIKRIYKSKVIRVKILWQIKYGAGFLSKMLSVPYWNSLNLSFTIRSLIPLIKFKPDIVMPGNGGIQTLLIKLASLIFGWKVVVVGHAGIGAPDKWNILLKPDIFISPSLRGKKWAESLFFSRGVKIEHIPHGIDLEKFSPEVKKVRISLQKPIILCVSSPDSYKRVDLAVRAVAKLDKGSLLVVGGYGSQNKVDILAKELLGSKRYLRLQVKPSEMPKYYASSDVFTLPSNEYESFGIAYLEALASNLPIVATNDELRREIVGDAGILVNPADIGSYSIALRKALGINWGHKPRLQAEKYSWEKVIKQYEHTFTKLIDKSD